MVSRPVLAQIATPSAPLPAEVAHTTDVVVGLGTAGPYPLAWKNVRAEGVSVVADGKTLAPADYTFDAAAGTITFLKALKNRAVARVDYGYEPGRAERNAVQTLQPITVSLLNTNGARGSFGFQVTALPGATGGTVGGSNATAAEPLLVWGLSGKTNLLGGGLSSEIMVSPDAQGKGAITDRTGVRLGYALATDKTKLDFSFSRAGDEFAPTAGKAFGMAEQAQRWSLAAQAAPAAWISGEIKMLDAHDLTGKGASGGSSVSLRLLGTGRAPVINFARVEDGKTAADGTATGITTETASLAGKSGQTTFNLQGGRVATDAAGEANDTTKQNAALTVATATKDNKTQATLVLGTNATETAAGTEASRNVALNAKLQPGSGTLSVSAQSRQVTNDGKTDQTKQENSLAVAAATKDNKAQASVTVSSGSTETAKGMDTADKIAVTAKVQAAPGLSVAAEAGKTGTGSRLAEGGKETSTGLTTGKVNVAAQIGSAALAVQGQRIVAEGSSSDKNQTQQDASVALSTTSKDKKTAASVAVTGGTTETATGAQARQGIEVKLQPSAALTLSAETRLQTTTPTDGDGKQSLLQSARAELRPVRDTVVSGALRFQSDGDARTSITDLNAQTQIGGRFLQFTGGMTERENTASVTDLLDTTRLRMTLRPFAAVSLTGGLTVNPEDKDGKITEATRQEYGLAAKVGALDLGGGYALTTLTSATLAPGVGPQSGELSLNLGLRFSRYTSLTGGYKDAFLWGGLEARGTRAVSLGLTHNVGSAFNFSLAGSRTEDKAEVGKPADMKADLKVGLKF